jgi:gluconolactonase
VSTAAGPDAIRRLAPGIRGPEGVAVDRDGNVYAGGADGVIRRLTPSGGLAAFARVSDGQLGGLAFDREDNLFVCDGFTGRVVKVDRLGRVEVFAEWAGARRLHVPNFPVFDAGGQLWVSDSFDRPLSALDFAAEYREPRGTGAIVRLRPDGRGEVVLDGLFMPNGLAIDPDHEWLYILQTTRHNCIRLRLGADTPHSEDYGPSLGGGPDGMAFDSAGELVITLPEQRRVIGLARDLSLRVIADDPEGELMPFPTNCAFGGPDFRDLFVANMHADHLPVIRLDWPGHPLLNRR